jgi:insertion element IS1 protein InsB
MEYIASDYWKPYGSIIPQEKHLQTKAETFTVEGYNSLFRHFFGKNEKKIEMLFQENRNVKNFCAFIDAPQKRNDIYT